MASNGENGQAPSRWTRHDSTSVVVRVCDRGLSSGRRRAGRGAPSKSVGSADARDRAGDGIGLKNTRERLALLYGDTAGLTLVREANETVASVWVPLAVGLDQARGAAVDTAPIDRTVADTVEAT